MRADHIATLLWSEPWLQEAIAHDLAARPYRLRKGFARWDSEILPNLAVGVRLLPDLAKGGDAATLFCGYLAGAWLTSAAPLFLCDRPILNLFAQTDLPDSPGNLLFQGLEPTWPVLIFCPPKGMITSPDGGIVDWFAVGLIGLGFAPQVNWDGVRAAAPGLRPGAIANLSLATIDTEGTSWFTGYNVAPDGSLYHDSPQALGLNPTNRREHDWLQQLGSMGIQLWLAANFGADLGLEILEGQQTEQAQRGRHQKRLARPSYWQPREIRARHSPRQGRSPSTGTHASPRTHWRRGHLRNQPVGAGRTGRRLVWIRPVLVGAKMPPIYKEEST